MVNINLSTTFNPLLHSYGLPYRVQNSRKFALSSSLKTINISDTSIISISKQQKFISVAMKPESGWFMVINSESYLDKPKNIAANIAQSYFDNNMKIRWLTIFDKLDKQNFISTKLVIIDSLFFDSSSYKRDKIYEAITHYANSPDISVILLSKHSDPISASTQLGLEPDFLVSFK